MGLLHLWDNNLFPCCLLSFDCIVVITLEKLFIEDRCLVTLVQNPPLIQNQDLSFPGPPRLYKSELQEHIGVGLIQLTLL